ncbi:DsbA family protein [Halobacteriales archaeon Cl-PHB]
MAGNSRTAEAVTVYGDYVCPFCYLGKHSLKQYRSQRTAPLGVEWHPFDLRSDRRDADGNIDPTVDDGKDDAYLEQVRENVQRLQTEYGADDMLDFDDVPDVDSLEAQIASYYIQRTAADRWESFDDRLYEVFWEDGRDIGSRDVIVDVATAVGIDGAELRAALDDEANRSAVFEAFDRANQAGITGVPTFVTDDNVARGAVPPARLERLIEGETSDPVR